jgi:hypothetical protein
MTHEFLTRASANRPCGDSNDSFRKLVVDETSLRQDAAQRLVHLSARRHLNHNCALTGTHEIVRSHCDIALVISSGSRSRIVGERQRRFGLDGRRKDELQLLCFQVTSGDVSRG